MLMTFLLPGVLQTFVTTLIDNLHLQFSLKDLETLSYLLGVHIKFIDDASHLPQQSYVLELL